PVQQPEPDTGERRESPLDPGGSAPGGRGGRSGEGFVYRRRGGQRGFLLRRGTDLERLFDQDPEREGGGHPWRQRLRKVHSSEAPDALLGCTGRTGSDLRAGRAGNQYI